MGMNTYILVYFAVTFLLNVSSHPATNISTELIEMFATKVHSDCLPINPKWANNQSYMLEGEKFLQYERRIENACNNSQEFYLKGGPLLYPSDCNTVTICNQTYCVQYSERASKFFVTLLGQCALDSDKLAQSRFLQSNSAFDLYNMLVNSKYKTQYERLQKIKASINFNPNFEETIHRKGSRACFKDFSEDYFFEGRGNLPSECDSVRICATDRNGLCFLLPKITAAYSFIFRRYDKNSVQLLQLPGSCDPPTPSRTRRHIVEFSEISMGNTNMSSYANPLLKFNLPGYRYCGPGTDVEKMDDLGGPVNELDNLCRDHDIAYQIGIPSDEADAKLLESIWNIKHPFLPLFVATFEAKRYYEIITGSSYTSSLYYFPERQHSLTYTMMKTSVYEDNKAETYDDANTWEYGLQLEKRWQKLLHDIWSGFCYAKEIPLGSDTEVNPQTGADLTLNPCQPSSSSSSAQPSYQGGSEKDDYVNVDIESQYPKPPPLYGKCRLIISEIGLKHGSISTFVELHRICPEGGRVTAKTMTGYHLLILRLGEPHHIVLSQSLSNHVMNVVQEQEPGKKRPIQRYYFVIGNDAARPDLNVNKIQYMVTPPDGLRGIPEADGSAFAVILLHFPDIEVARETTMFLNMQAELRNPAKYMETPIDDHQKNIIATYLQDMMIYGSPCPIEICEFFMKLVPSPMQVQPVNFNFLPFPYIIQRDQPPFYSMNWCSKNTLPMQMDDFLEGPATPGTRNACPVILEQVFSLQGSRLQSSAQKLVVNVHQYLKTALVTGIDHRISAAALTSQACSLSLNTVNKVLENWREGHIVTPGKRRKVTPLKQSQIDNFNADAIKTIIQNFYAENKAPFFKDIFDQFKKQLLDQEELRRNAGEVVVPLTMSDPTFRKVLHRLGFKFGKINLRDVILMRQDIVMWRGRYLNQIRDARNSDPPTKIIYLDETWIDPHARTGKAWVPAKCVNYRERSKYTFKRHKVSKGPRIIVLHAGGEDGFIHNVMDVFPVHKKDVTGDYHDNVNAEYYTAWFKKLLAELNRTGNKYIIVQDNAPYHSVTEVPKQKDRKAVMYEWLQLNLPAAEKQNMKTLSKSRKWELWDKIKQLKSKQPYYRIDKLAVEAGHRIIRHVYNLLSHTWESLLQLFNFLKGWFLYSLPPYNCDLNPIEFVWKDIKDQVKKSNVDQNVKTITEVAKTTMLNYPAQKWKNHIQHIIKLEDAYWKQDGFFEEIVDRPSFIVPNDDEDDEEDDNLDENAPIPVDPEIVASTVHDWNNDDDDELLDV